MRCFAGSDPARVHSLRPTQATLCQVSPLQPLLLTEVEFMKATKTDLHWSRLKLGVMKQIRHS